MKFAIVLCAALACVVAKPQQLGARWAIPDDYAWASTRLAAPIAYAAAPIAYAAPVAAAIKTQYLGQDELGMVGYGHHMIAASAPVAAVHTGPVLRDAIQTTVVNTPGHAVSYRVD